MRCLGIRRPDSTTPTIAVEVPENPTLPISQRYWLGGADSWSVPDQLNPNQYPFGLNIINRGGIPRTRPGNDTLFCLPPGNPQGLTIFTPATGVPHIVSAVEGRVYVSAPPFMVYRQLPNIQFNPAARFVTWASCLKSTQYLPNGDIDFEPTPRKVLVMQDGVGRAAFWDGGQSRHLNPSMSAVGTMPGMDETPIGLWMIWSNNRLWVARGNRVFSSDLGNPLKFVDRRYLNEAPSFYLPDDCTGMARAPLDAGIYVFYNGGCDFIETSIQDRTQWLQVSNMQREAFPVGCVAGKSIVTNLGLVRWFAPHGWTSINEAQIANLDSEIPITDNEMAFSKAYLSQDLEGICAASFGNFELISVPFADPRNTHTWVRDRDPRERQKRWAGVWTGCRPVEWAVGSVNGFDRVFFLSADVDGSNRVWEAFKPSCMDNGCPITCSVQFRMENFGIDERQRYSHAEIDLAECLGDVSIMAAVGSWRGAFDRVMTKEIVASIGRVRYDQQYGPGALPNMGSNKPQVRTVRTESWLTPSTCNECGVEMNAPVNIDRGFQLFVGWSGRAGILGLRQFTTQEAEDHQQGNCETNESGFRSLDVSGCGSFEEFFDPDPFESILGNGSHSGPGLVPGIETVTIETCATSQISAADAARKASCAAFHQYGLLATAEGLSPFSAAFGCTVIRVIAPAELAIYNEDGSQLISSLVDFGTIFFGNTADVTLRLVNVGFSTLTISAATVSGEFFSVIEGPIKTTLAPGDFTFITLRFAPVE